MSTRSVLRQKFKKTKVQKCDSAYSLVIQFKYKNQMREKQKVSIGKH